MNRTDFPDLAAFHAEIKRVQQKAHGQHYTDNHEALQKYGAECPIQKELGVSQGGTLAALMLTNPKIPIKTSVTELPRIILNFSPIFLNIIPSP